MRHAGSGLRALLVLLGAAFLLSSGRARAGDPYVPWLTLTTPHYHVHFHAGIEQVAQRVATVAEDVYERVSPELGYRPTVRTEIVLTDATEDANGLAYTLPYSTVNLYVSAPDDMSSLGDYDDWVTELTTHELTHILHMENVSGIPDVVNHVFGRTLAPNQEQPHWILEGLAVAMESEHTSGGRLRGTQFDMMLRADLLEGNAATLDEISHYARRWPSATLWYLYGAKFIEWIASIYGPDIYAAVATDYGASLVPYGVNRAIRRATGRTYEDLYAGFLRDLAGRYAAQQKAVLARGLRAGRRLTFRGWQALGPRFLPPSCGKAQSVAYVRADADSLPGVYTVGLDAGGGADETPLARSAGRSLAYGPDCSLYFDSVVPSRRKYPFGDLFRLPPGERSSSGLDRRRVRLTEGRRARDVDVSRDGRRLVYVTNDGGTTTLRIAALTADGRVAEERRLVQSGELEQVYTPRFSPDGTRVAFSAWTAGGYRDLRIVDVDGSHLVELWHDRALDQQPVFSPDGRYLYFTSDRSGIANVYALELATGELSQVTNVVTGAYMPEPSPDGRTLVYVGYTSTGFDLYALELDRASWLPAEPAKERPRPAALAPRTWPVTPYHPLPTLAPRAYTVGFGTGTFGNALTLSTTGSDAIGRHAFAGTLIYEPRYAALFGSLDYFYGGLPFGFHAGLYRSAAPRASYSGTGTTISVPEWQLGATTGVDLPLPGDFDNQGIGLSYSLAEWDHSRPLASTTLDPFAPMPSEPDRSILASVELSYQLSTASATTYAISAERGFALGLTADFADKAWGSEETLTAFAGAFTGYLSMPWLRHHVLALGLSGGAAAGSYRRQQYFYTGGFADTPLVDAVSKGVRQTAFRLRGYKPLQFYGSNFGLLNLEYRFPIAYVDRGLSTLPGFLRTLSGTAFLDWGGTYEVLDLRDPWEAFHVGVGGELRIDLSLVYADDAQFRLGLARGLDSAAPHGLQSYFVLASTF